MNRIITLFAVLSLVSSFSYSQSKSKLDTTMQSLDYFLGTWTALMQGQGQVLYSQHLIEPILSGKFIRRSVIQGFNGLELTPYTEETIGWNAARKEIELVNHNAPGFIIHGTIEVLDETKFERVWTLYNSNGVEMKGKDIWEIMDEKMFEWSQFFFREDEWVEAPYSPFKMNRSKN